MANRDPSRPPRYWAPEAWRLVCASYDAFTRLPYDTADARLIDGWHKWMLRTGKAQPVPSPWWTLATGLCTAIVPALADPASAALLKPWAAAAATHAPADAGPDAFRPLGG